MSDQFLTPRQLADRWMVSLRTLARWRALREGPAFMPVGHAIRYSLASIEAFESATVVRPLPNPDTIVPNATH